MAKSALRPVRRCFGSLAAALGLICALSSGSARAQATDDPEELLKAALTEFKAGRWNEAYALFERLHREEPSARTLRGMGLSAFEASRYAAAITDLKAALLEARRPLDGAQRKEVQSVIQQADRFVARCALRLTPASAELAVDGRDPLFEKDGILLLDPGSHQIVATAAGYQTQSRTLDVRGGERIELAFGLQPTGSVAPTAAEETSETTLEPETQGSDGSVSPVLGYVAAGAAVLFAGGAIGLHFAAKGAATDVETACGGRCTPEQADFQIDESGVEIYQTLSFVGWGLCAASAATSAVLFVLAADGGSPDEGEASVALRVAPTRIDLSGRF